MISTFINREKELELLWGNWNSTTAEFIVITGRRRVGKTRLIEYFLRNKNGVFHTAKETTRQSQINDLQSDVATYFNDSFLKNTQISSWESFFSYLEKIIPKGERFFFFIDEFSYIIKSDPEIISTLQKYWDRYLSKTKIFFVVSGSVISMMQESVLSHASPLYGRRTRDIFLEELDITNSSKFLRFSNIEKLMCYGITGGVPSYLLVASKYSKLLDFLNSEFFNKQGFFYREPFYILSQEFREIKTYFSILNAISLGKNSATEIGNFCGIDTRKIYPYLTNLLYLNFVKKEIPLIVRTNYGKYYLKDKMLDFWFNFVDKYRTVIEKEQFVFSRDEFKSFFGRVFEELIRENILNFTLPFKPARIGKWWYKDNEIDIIAINDETNEILIGECKWRDNVNVKKISGKLKKKSKLIDSKNKIIHYVIFAKSFQDKTISKDVLLYDLRDIENLFFTN